MRTGEIKGYGYAPRDVEIQTLNSDLIARVRHLSVEPSFRTRSAADPEDRYLSYVHLSFSIIEPLKGAPAGDVVVVEYLVYGGMPTEAQAIEKAKKWIASERDVWWHKREAIIFLDDLRFRSAGSKVSEISTGAYYEFANHSSSCCGWTIHLNNSYGNWVWLPYIGEDASLELPDSERMFRVVVDPYEVDSYEHRARRPPASIGFASLADIKAILEAYGADGTLARDTYLDQRRLLWEAKSSDSYSFVYSYVNEDGSTLRLAIKTVVRNGEVVEAFFVEDVEWEGKVWTAWSRIEPEMMSDYDLLTLELDTFFWQLAQGWVYRNPVVPDVSFDNEFGYPTAIRFGKGDVIYVSEYTPLDN